MNCTCLNASGDNPRCPRHGRRFDFWLHVFPWLVSAVFLGGLIWNAVR